MTRCRICIDPKTYDHPEIGGNGAMCNHYIDVHGATKREVWHLAVIWNNEMRDAVRERHRRIRPSLEGVGRLEDFGIYEANPEPRFKT